MGSASEPPRIVGDYVLKRRLGSGAMGEVWLGWHRFTESLGAVKLLKETAALRGRVRRALDREQRAIARLSHPNIVSLHDVGPDYIVTAYIDGPNLAQRLSTPIEPASAIRIAVQIASALAHAHVHGVVHRDVKPGNVLLDSAGNGYLADFGLAMLAGESLEGRSLRAGTPGYMAPEQRLGMIATPAADQYALGRTLLEMLVGSSLPESDAEALAALPRSLPSALGKLLARALARVPEDRFATVEAFAEQIAGIDLEGHAAPMQLAPEVRLRTPFAWSAAPVAVSQISPEIARADYTLGALAKAGLLSAEAVERFRDTTGYAELGWSLYAHTSRLGPISHSSLIARASDVIVLAHGALCTRRVWRALAAALCRENAQAIVLVPDLIGFGQSPFDPERFRAEHATPRALADAQLAWLDMLGVRELPTVLVGHSVAGAALLCVSDELLGERTSRIAVTPVFPFVDWRLRLTLRVSGFLLRTLCRFEPLRRLVGRLLLHSPDIRAYAPEERAQIRERFLEVPPSALAALTSAVARAVPHASDRLDRCLIVVGKDDPLVPEAQVLAALGRLGIPRRSLHRLASGGHVPHLESDAHPEWTLRNVDQLARLVESMLLSAREGTPESTLIASTVLEPSADVARSA
jgi:serine/threonine protein kinase